MNIFSKIFWLNLLYTFTLNSGNLAPGYPANIVINIGVANISKDIPRNEFLVYLKNILQGSKNNLPIVRSFLEKNKLILAGCGVATLYFRVLYEIVIINKLLNSKQAWLSWKSEFAFEKLTIIPQADLSKELVSEINRRFIDSNCTNSNQLLAFINEINLELEKLNSYIKLINRLKFFKLNRLFQINDNSINLVQEKINRLNYLKNIFLNNVISNTLLTRQ